MNKVSITGEVTAIRHRLGYPWTQLEVCRKLATGARRVFLIEADKGLLPPNTACGVELHVAADAEIAPPAFDHGQIVIATQLIATRITAL